MNVLGHSFLFHNVIFIFITISTLRTKISAKGGEGWFEASTGVDCGAGLISHTQEGGEIPENKKLPSASLRLLFLRLA